MRMLGRVGCTSSVLKAAGCFRQVAAILDGAEDKHDQPISESGIRQITLQAASTESPEKQRRTIETSSQSKVHESGEKGKDARVHRTLLPV